MENLKHLYYFEETRRGIGSRYSIGQILYDFVHVPDYIVQACKAIRGIGGPRNYKPSSYMLKYAERIIEQIPRICFDDLVFLCRQLGTHLSLSVNKRIVERMVIALNDKARVGFNIRGNRNVEQSLLSNEETGSNFDIIILYAPDYD